MSPCSPKTGGTAWLARAGADRKQKGEEQDLLECVLTGSLRMDVGQGS